DVEAGHMRDLLDPRGPLIHKHTHAPHTAARLDLSRPLGLDIPRAPLVKIKPDCGCSILHGRLRILCVRDPADLDDHAATSSASAAAGSAAFIRYSPTRNAVYPAPRSRCTSAAE